jgi:hypothetical protein
VTASTRQVQSCRNGRHAGGALPCVDPETGIVDQLGKSVDCLKWLPSGCSSDTDWRATNASSAMRPSDRTRSAQFREQLELVGGHAQHAQRPGGVDGGISQRQRRSDRLHPTEAEQDPGRAAAPRPLVRRAAPSRPPPARPYAAGPPTPAPQSSSDSSAVRFSSSINQTRAVGLQSIHNSLSNAPNSPSSVPRFARQRRSQTQITALGNCRTR